MRLPMPVIALSSAVASLLAWPTAPSAAVPPRLPPDERVQPVAPPSIALDGSLVVLWQDGSVLSRQEGQPADVARALVLGERIGPGSLIECRGSCRASLLSGGDRLVAFTGPGRWLVETAQLSALPVPGQPPEVPSRLPAVQVLTTYREGPLPTLEALSSQPMLAEIGPPLSLALLSPLAPVTRSERPEVRWHWPFPAGRFDLVIERLDDSGETALAILEQWRNLDELSHTLWSPLELGGTYRITVSHAGGTTPISDTRTIHVLGPSEAAAVDGALASLDALQGTGSRYRPELDVLRARILESHGLWGEAEAVWTGLAILYPGRDDVLHQAFRLHAKSLGRD